jgi:hypothetical protein
MRVGKYAVAVCNEIIAIRLCNEVLDQANAVKYYGKLKDVPILISESQGGNISVPDEIDSLRYSTI